MCVYKEIENENIKIVHKDYDRTTISVGILQEYDPELKTLKIIKSSGKIVFINASAIEKLEVLR